MNTPTRLSGIILVTALLGACLSSYAGGPPTSRFSGIVTDTSGAPVPGVKITLFWTNTNTEQSMTTDANGSYTFANVSANGSYGTYEISASKSGFGFLASIGNPKGSVVKSDYMALFKTVIALPSYTPVQVSDADFIAMAAGEKLVSLPRTGQTVSYATGDDATFLKGTPWPHGRFTDNGDGTVSDSLTGLIWLKDAGCLRAENWFNALTDANQLASSSCGLNDGSTAGQWRMPDIAELESLVDASTSNPAVSVGNPFINIADTYWSSTTYRGVTTNAWVIRFADGRYINDSVGNAKSTSNNNVWAVRSAGVHGAINLPATGQFIPYAAGDDASSLKGVRMTYPRFIDNGDGTVADTVTGLIWMKKADCIHSDWWNAISAISNLANGQCGLSDGSISGQWRMPNRAELLSLGDRAETNQALRFNTVFYNKDGSVDQPAVFDTFLESEYLWTSTTEAASPTFAWTVYSCDYGVYNIPKTSTGYSLAVRGQTSKENSTSWHDEIRYGSHTVR
jgi:hypothetical protein